ncbi:hypothetical protein FHG87_024541 [Trinorchestia longiramus]|nr:hypothetical protein FHG87_024541 [Trinorchestia longiramus]
MGQTARSYCLILFCASRCPELCTYPGYTATNPSNAVQLSAIQDQATLCNCQLYKTRQLCATVSYTRPGNAVQLSAIQDQATLCYCQLYKTRQRCATVSYTRPGNAVQLSACLLYNDNQTWRLSPSTCTSTDSSTGNPTCTFTGTSIPTSTGTSTDTSTGTVIGIPTNNASTYWISTERNNHNRNSCKEPKRNFRYLRPSQQSSITQKTILNTHHVRSARSISAAVERFTYLLVATWSQLPENIVSTGTVNALKNHLDKYWIRNPHCIITY